ncbi:MAG: TlpA disulfide reductase family protein [Pseudomonadota bacterium]
MHWFTASLSFGAGLAAMWLMTSASSSSDIAPENYYDLSALPEQLAAKYADPKYLQSLIEQEEMRDKMIAAHMAERAARPAKNLPADMPKLPFELKLFAPKDGSHWPEFSDAALQESLNAVKDDWVVLNYWASWCAPCIAELPDMDLAAPELASRGVQLLALNVNHLGDDSAEKIEGIFSDRSVANLPKLRTADGDIQTAIEAAGMSPTQLSLPHNIIFAPGGVPFAYFDGLPEVPEGTAIWNSDDMLTFFEALAASDL